MCEGPYSHLFDSEDDAWGLVADLLDELDVMDQAFIVWSGTPFTPPRRLLAPPPLVRQHGVRFDNDIHIIPSGSGTMADPIVID